MRLGLAGRRAVVTGGSKGLGRAIAQELLAEGASVAICSRNQAEISQTGEELSCGGGKVYARVCDVTKVDEVNEFLAGAALELGGIDILVNNAGAATPGRFGDLSDEQWAYDFEVKLMSQIRLIRAALGYLRSSSQARVININAIFARYPDPVFLASSVNRASCLSLSKALSIELAPEKILVNSVNIGYVKTPQWESIRQRRQPDTTSDDFFRHIAEQEVPMKRFGTADEVSGVVAFLASERASYITGATIDVAGGFGKYL